MTAKTVNSPVTVSVNVGRRKFGVAGLAIATGMSAFSAVAGAAKSGHSKSKAALQSPDRVGARFPTSYMPAGGSNARRGEIVGSPGGGQHALTNLINAEFGLQAAALSGQQGLAFQMKDTGYRGIPLWAVKGIVIHIDGNPVAPDDVLFTLDNRCYRLAELPSQKGTQWWVFDWATIFVGKPGGFALGEYLIHVEFTYISLYGTKPTDLAVLRAEERMTLRPIAHWEA